MTPADEHYFDPSPSSTSHPIEVEVVAGTDRFTALADRGTFSSRRLDPATAFLLERAPRPPDTGRFLDLGCGWGPIALALGRRCPEADVVAVDVNDRAVELCRTNARRLGLRNVSVARPDDVEVGDGFDLIWSNPPVRIGKQAMHDLLIRWVATLRPEGRAVIVMGRNLGADSLQRWLQEQGHPTERLGSRRGFRLLEIARS